MAQRKFNRIDVHHHLSPPGYIAELGPNQRLTPQTLAWTPQKAIEQMDQGGVDLAITSITTPGLWFGLHSAARRLARLCNDYAAKIRTDHPGRFGLFVNLPIPDVDGSLAEIEYGMDQLKADGVCLFTSYGDKWIGDPAFDRVFDELNRRKAVVYVHPTTCNCCTNLLPGFPDSAIEYGTDTTRAMARLVFSGTFARCPDIKMIWSHGGGTMPFLYDRFNNATKMPQYKDQFPGGWTPVANKMHYDIAQVPNKPALSALSAVVQSSQILFGTDFPWLDSAHHVKGLKESGVFNEAQLRQIDIENAARLMPQYAV